MKQTDKHPYEPPVVEVFELQTEHCLQVTSPATIPDPDPIPW